jgi:hypothetical protein
LRRLGQPTSSVITDEAPQARAAWFFAVFVGRLLTAAAMLIQSCEPSEQQPAAVRSYPTSASRHRSRPND